MKQEEVMERVYEPGRLHEAWQQVKKNAGVAGIDKMTVEEFESRETELLGIIHENRQIPFQTGTQGTDTKGRDFQDEEVRDSSGNGPNSEPERESCIRRDIRSRLHGIQFWISQRQEPAYGDTTRSR